MAICNPGREALSEANPDGTFLLDFPLPELREHKFVKILGVTQTWVLSWVYFAMTAQFRHPDLTPAGLFDTPSPPLNAV